MSTETDNMVDEASPNVNSTCNGDSGSTPEELSLKLKEEGNAALTAGHFTDATRLYSQALKHTPNNAVLLSNRAFVYIKIESYGLAIEDATNAIKADPSYAKAYYRRGTAQFALQKTKAARKDFRMVCKLKPKDRDARAKLAACEKAVKEAMFAAAIESEATIPLSETYDLSCVTIDDKYDGPHPAGKLLDDMETESLLFQPGSLPMDFVMVSLIV